MVDKSGPRLYKSREAIRRPAWQHTWLREVLDPQVSRQRQKPRELCDQATAKLQFRDGHSLRAAACGLHSIILCPFPLVVGGAHVGYVLCSYVCHYRRIPPLFQPPHLQTGTRVAVSDGIFGRDLRAERRVVVGGAPPRASSARRRRARYPLSVEAWLLVGTCWVGPVERIRQVRPCADPGFRQVSGTALAGQTLPGSAGGISGLAATQRRPGSFRLGIRGLAGFVVSRDLHHQFGGASLGFAALGHSGRQS